MMSQRSRRELLTVVVPRYRAAQGTDRKRILDEFVGSSGYHRKYALQLLNHPPKAPPVRKRRQRAPRYSSAVQQALITCWHATNGICSKRLVPYLPELVAVLEQHGELWLDVQTKMQLLSLSAATADRLLRAERQRSRPHGLGTTKPGTLLKHQIPIRTFADWDDAVPGFVEVDLVAHCGESTHGEYVNSLTVTDITTTWTECLALRTRSQHTVHAAIGQARTRLPFPLLGLDSDNGTEFINDLLLRYCQQEQITFTRSRPYKKNDQAHVEQKNWSIVRQTVGYDRYESQDACDALAALYEVVRLYTNFFQPSMKLHSKERLGSIVKKTYDTAKTPYQRVLESEQVTQESKVRLQAQYRTLNPVALLRQIEQRQASLWKLAVRVRGTQTPQQAVQVGGSLS
ncbi:MAG TPA: DDE-type integrase/transposase/recombinase [Ktedonobacteraceae bacterium]|nr:DDE-type integrase/transposase/recombinase [Ktedonobacteraceae bacterium]